MASVGLHVVFIGTAAQEIEIESYCEFFQNEIYCLILKVLLI